MNRSENKVKANEKANEKLSDSNSMKHKLALVKELELGQDFLLRCWENIVLSRKIDDAEIFLKKQNKAFFQISGAGHEGILTALGFTLKPAYDYVIAYYRDRALCTALGVTPYEMLCQANGNIGDTASGARQMPSHWGNKKLNIISKSSCTGTQFLQAVGLAEAGQYLEQVGADPKQFPRHSDEIILVSTGDGTTSQGEFWEALTTACVKKLPVLFLVEDNGYAISVPVSEQTPGGSISKALEHFPGLTVERCDGSCPIDSLRAVRGLAKQLRSREVGPVLLHATVTRPYSHSLSDDHGHYRSKQELAQERARDVFHTFPAFLIDSGLATAAQIKQVEERVALRVKEEMERALATPWPKKETFADHLYSSQVDPSSEQFERSLTLTGKDDIPMASSINRVLRSELKRNPLMRMFGEDVADFTELEKFEHPGLVGKGGVFKVTSGCQRVAYEAGRPQQVFNSPLAEANIIGRAIGMALRGIKPVVEIQFFDYIWTAYMQLKNELATMRYRSGGTFSCPMVVRVPIGGYLRGGAMYHSQCGESLFTHIPGLRVVFPSNALDAAGLLRTAIRCDDPVLFLEHKHLYYQGNNRTADPGEDWTIPFGRANVVRAGKDLTIVCWGALVHRCLEAAKILEREGVEVEVIDARTLAPFDLETVLTSLRKTHRLLVAHEEHLTSGFAGEIAALVMEHGFELLDAPMLRVCAKDTHIAYCPDLEEVILPQVEDVLVAARKVIKF